MLEKLNESEMNILFTLYEEKEKYHKNNIDALFGQVMNLTITTGQEINECLKAILENKVKFMKELKDKYEEKYKPKQTEVNQKILKF